MTEPGGARLGAWEAGQGIVRRDVWRGQPKVAWGGIVVADTPELLALYMPEGSPLAFAPDFFGAPHPWSEKDRWEGHGVLQLQRPEEMHAVWVFWQGAERELGAWYVNIQEPFRRTGLGVDTQDLELDIVVSPDGSWRYKDDEKLEGWIERGRWTPAEVATIRAEGRRVARLLDQGERWWSEEWADWQPDPDWPHPTLTRDWRLEAQPRGQVLHRHTRAPVAEQPCAYSVTIPLPRRPLGRTCCAFGTERLRCKT